MSLITISSTKTTTDFEIVEYLEIGQVTSEMAEYHSNLCLVDAIELIT
jgi:hypothetical protein